jgi:hypothetical protein
VFFKNMSPGSKTKDSFYDVSFIMESNTNAAFEIDTSGRFEICLSLSQPSIANPVVMVSEYSMMLRKCYHTGLTNTPSGRRAIFTIRGRYVSVNGQRLYEMPKPGSVVVTIRHPESKLMTFKSLMHPLPLPLPLIPCDTAKAILGGKGGIYHRAFENEIAERKAEALEREKKTLEREKKKQFEEFPKFRQLIRHEAEGPTSSHLDTFLRVHGIAMNWDLDRLLMELGDVHGRDRGDIVEDERRLRHFHPRWMMLGDFRDRGYGEMRDYVERICDDIRRYKQWRSGFIRLQVFSREFIRKARASETQVTRAGSNRIACKA